MENLDKYEIFANGKTHTIYAVNQYDAIAKVKRRDNISKGDIIYIRLNGRAIKFEEPHIKFMGMEYPL